MTDMFVSLGTWNWLIFGFILMALEVLAPGVFLFWLGLAALLVGLISFAVAVSWQIQLVMFAIFAAAAVPRNARRFTSCPFSPELLAERDSRQLPAIARRSLRHAGSRACCRCRCAPRR